MAAPITQQSRQSAEERRKFAIAWNQTMVKIWKERIQKLGVIDTGALYRSVINTDVSMDSDAMNITEREMFLEYGIWQDLGTGAEVPKGNSGDIGRQKRRQRRRWFAPKYFGSVMAIKEFMAESIGLEFIGLVAAGLDADQLRADSNHYRRKGYK